MVDAKIEEVENLKVILMCFEAVTGLKVNLAKSSLMVISKEAVDMELGSQAARVLGCAIGTLPFSYLGLPLGAKARQRQIWDPVIEKIQKRLAPWKKKYMSRGGRLTLINSTLSSIPIYFLSLFAIPAAVAKKIEKLCRDFLWGDTLEKKTFHWVGWKKTSRPKVKGGLGIRKIKLTNRALLAKWIWRYGSEKKHMWRKLIRQKYGGNEETWYPDPVRTPHGTSLWKGIMTSLPLITENSRITLNNGENTSFWKENWCTNIPLRDKYPRIWKVCTSKNATVNEVIHGAATNSSCNLGLKRNLKDEEIAEVVQLVHDIGNAEIISNIPDRRHWLHSATGEFSAKSCYKIQDEEFHEEGNDFVKPHIFWNDIIPTKISFFIWATLWNALPTMDVLVRRAVVPPTADTRCKLCLTEEETSNHILLHCPFVYEVWSYFLRYTGISRVMPFTTGMCLDGWSRKFPNDMHNFIWNCLPHAIWWAVWMERNRRTFHNKNQNEANTVIAVKSLLYQWGLPTKAFGGLYFDDLVARWEEKLYPKRLGCY